MTRDNDDKSNDEKSTEGFLSGQLLIAMPAMQDDRFARSVIYMCAHTDEGAMGIIVNKPAEHISFGDLLEQLDLAEENQIIVKQDTPVHVGGPVETRRGFVLHSNDYHSEDSTLTIDDRVSLTATVDILKAISEGKGPRNALLALGYAGWAPGQLESEIQANGWLHCTPDEALVFETSFEKKYDSALGKLGIDPSFLAMEAGHA